MNHANTPMGIPFSNTLSEVSSSEVPQRVLEEIRAVVGDGSTDVAMVSEGLSGLRKVSHIAKECFRDQPVRMKVTDGKLTIGIGVPFVLFGRHEVDGIIDS